MKAQILVYGLAKDETREWAETLLAATCRNENDVKAVKAAAAKDGFHGFRVTTWDGSPPNFARCIA